MQPAVRPATETAGVLGRLGLGSVQFGQAYGISNTRGQVPLDDVRLILDLAARFGIRLLDTAANYGQAEEILSRAGTAPFRIVSKTISVGHGVEAVIARARQSVRTLGRVDMLLVHNVSDLTGPQGDALWRALRDLKDEGAVGGIGLSAYVADGPAALARRFRPDAMQIPFSLLDQRLLHDGTLLRLKELGVEVHARSLFLQGLFFMPQPPARLSAAAPLLDRVRTHLAEAGTTPLAAALAFVLSRPEIDAGVIGLTSRAELEQIMATALAPLPELDWKACALEDARILTPSLW